MSYSSLIKSIGKTAIINIFEEIDGLFYSDRQTAVKPNYHVTAVTCNNQLPAFDEYILSHSSLFKQHPIISGAIPGKTIGLRL